MSGTVSYKNVVADYQNILAGNTVVGTPLETAAISAMWASGRGAQIIPTFAPNVSVTTARGFRFKIRPRYQASMLRWVIGAGWTNNTADPPAIMTAVAATSSGGTSPTATFNLDPLTADSTIIAPLVFDQLLTASSSAEEDAILVLTATNGTAQVRTIACFEYPRTELGYNTNDGGVDLSTLRFRERIAEGTGKSMGGLADGVVTAFSTARRAGLFQWAIGDSTTTAISLTGSPDGIPSTTYRSIFRDGPQFLARKLYTTSTTGLATIRVYGRYVGATGTGDVSFTPASGGAVKTFSFSNSASFAWATAQTAVVDCEDLTVNDGRRATRWDRMDMEWRTANTAHTLYIGAISVYEDAP